MNEQLYDPIRKQWVADEPEERVRQALIRRMIDELGFPAQLLSLEKKLSQLSHVETEETPPDRRIDLLAYGSINQKLVPLLLVECKSVPLTPAHQRQVAGYNRFVQAPFYALVNQNELELFVTPLNEGESVQTINWLPPYEELLSSAAARCS